MSRSYRNQAQKLQVNGAGITLREQMNLSNMNMKKSKTAVRNEIPVTQWKKLCQP